MADADMNIHVLSMTLAGGSLTQRDAVARQIERYARVAVKRHGIRVDFTHDSEYDALEAGRADESGDTK
jgi:hypothetical protein